MSEQKFQLIELKSIESGSIIILQPQSAEIFKVAPETEFYWNRQTKIAIAYIDGQPKVISLFLSQKVFLKMTPIDLAINYLKKAP
jgi:hypothetical protein